MKQPKPGSNSAAMDNLGGLDKETTRTVEIAEKAIETCEVLTANTAALDKVAKAIEDSTKNLKGKNDSLAARLGKIVAALVILLAGIAVGALSLGTSGLNYGQAVAAATQAVDTSERVDTIRTHVASIDRKADKILLAQERPVIIPPAPADSRLKQVMQQCPDYMAVYLSQEGALKASELAENYAAKTAEQFDKVLQSCRHKEAEMKYPRPKHTVRDIANYEKEARVRTPVERRTNRGGDLTEEELGLIRRRMLQRFGEPAPGTVDYGVMETRGSPAPGCVRRKREDDKRGSGMQIARWECPKGTVKRLGL